MSGTVASQGDSNLANQRELIVCLEAASRDSAKLSGHSLPKDTVSAGGISLILTATKQRATESSDLGGAV